MIALLVKQSRFGVRVAWDETQPSSSVKVDWHIDCLE